MLLHYYDALFLFIIIWGNQVILVALQKTVPFKTGIFDTTAPTEDVTQGHHSQVRGHDELCKAKRGGDC